MKTQSLFATILSAVAVAAGAAVKPRGGTCRLDVSFSRGQNPIAGGDNSLACTAKMHYADGSEEELTTECRDVMRDHCYASKLPYTACIHTNENLKDGYLNYADQHVDFHDDGCKSDSYAGPAGDGSSQQCSFPC